MDRRGWFGLLLVSAWALVALLAGGSALADGPAGAPPGAVLVDGLAVLAGGSPAEEDDATPITVGQLELEADLLLLRRHGPDWTRVAADTQLRRQARRVATLVRLLARQARQMGETVAVEDRDAALAWLEDRAGGSGALRELMARRGADPGDLAAWVEDALLAQAQILFLVERTGPVDERGEGDRDAGREGDASREQGTTRRAARAVRTRDALAEWLAGALERTVLRLLP
ncbi:MAG TPA: hypothetical protein VM285_01120 [Polyangia bacterium]|nr:hypothetical protein [Polyangia bacterium]